jgi:hypothetical protein
MASRPGFQSGPVLLPAQSLSEVRTPQRCSRLRQECGKAHAKRQDSGTVAPSVAVSAPGEASAVKPCPARAKTPAVRHPWCPVGSRPLCRSGTGGCRNRSRPVRRALAGRSAGGCRWPGAPPPPGRLAVPLPRSCCDTGAHTASGGPPRREGPRRLFPAPQSLVSELLPASVRLLNAVLAGRGTVCAFPCGRPQGTDRRRLADRSGRTPPQEAGRSPDWRHAETARGKDGAPPPGSAPPDVRLPVRLCRRRLAGPLRVRPGSVRAWGLDVEDTAQEVAVWAELPGFETSELDVQLSGNLLTVRLERTVTSPCIDVSLADAKECSRGPSSGPRTPAPEWPGTGEPPTATRPLSLASRQRVWGSPPGGER